MRSRVPEVISALKSGRAILPAILVGAAAYMWIYRHMTTDDTFIFAQYVSNMLGGGGMSFNAGDPTYGFTSVLWVGLLYVAGLGGGDLLLCAKALSFAFALLSIIAFHFLAGRFLNSAVVVHAATAAFAINPIFVNIAFSGMESTLGTFLLLAGLWRHFSERESRRLLPLAPAIFALAYLTRPEFLLLFPLWLLDTWQGADRSIRLKRLLSGVILYAVPVGVWLGIALVQFDTVVPNPVIIKALQSRTAYETLYVVRRFFLMLGSIHAADLAVIVICAVALFVRGRGSGRRSSLLPGWPEAFLWLWAAGVLGSYLLQNVAMSPRYFLIVSPVLTLLAFRMLATLQASNPSLRKSWTGLVLILFALQSFVATAFIYYPHTVTYNQKDQLLMEAALWLRRNTPEGTAVASVDIGILGYYSNRRVVDQTGLVNPDIIRRTSALGYLRDKNVGYLLDRSPVPGQLVNRTADPDWLVYEPVLFLSTRSTGWTAELTEGDRIGFTLYRLSWKDR